MTKLGGQTSTRFAVDFFPPLLRTQTFPLCHLTNVISSGKMQTLFSSQPFPLSESSPLRSLQQSAPNPRILSLPAGRAETQAVPSPSPPTTLIHQIPSLQPTPSPAEQSWHQMSTDKGGPSIKKQWPISRVPAGPGQRARSEPEQHPSILPGHGEGTRRQHRATPSPPKGYSSPPAPGI